MKSYDIIVFILAIVGAVIAYGAEFVSKKLTEDEHKSTKLKIKLKFLGLGFLTLAVILIMAEKLL